MQYKNYLIRKDVVCPHLFNLNKIAVVQKGDNVGTEREEVLAYGVTLERAFALIASYEANDETLRGYISDYRAVVNDLKRWVKEEGA